MSSADIFVLAWTVMFVLVNSWRRKGRGCRAGGAACGADGDVAEMRWYVSGAYEIWPPAGPSILARTVLIAFTDPSEATLRHLSAAVLDAKEAPNTGPGAAWVAEARATAVRVLAEAPSAQEVEEEVREHWSLAKGQ